MAPAAHGRRNRLTARRGASPCPRCQQEKVGFLLDSPPERGTGLISPPRTHLRSAHAPSGLPLSVFPLALCSQTVEPVLIDPLPYLCLCLSLSFTFIGSCQLPLLSLALMSSSSLDSQTGPVDPFQSPHELCEACVDYVLENVNTVQYLIQSIEGITGKPFSRDRIKCLPAVPYRPQRPQPVKEEAKRAVTPDARRNEATGKVVPGALTLSPDKVFAGYMWRRARPDCEKGDIVLVEEHLPQVKKLSDVAQENKEARKRGPTTTKALLEQEYRKALNQAERNLRHELIHAFDDARGFVESADCTHQACSEIRAARLSGDCFAGEEAKKGRFAFFQGGLQCVRRRATMAVEMNPVCRGFSERAVETVFQRCYSDYEPYVAPVYALGSYGDDRFENGTLKL